MLQGAKIMKNKKIIMMLKEHNIDVRLVTDIFLELEIIYPGKVRIIIYKNILFVQILY
jgi:hypothetical protein